MDDLDICELLEVAGNVIGACEVSLFKGVRNGDLVEVEIRDYGPRRARRYQCWVETADGRLVCGNAEATIEAAIAVTPWFDLDRTKETSPKEPAPKKRPTKKTPATKTSAKATKTAATKTRHRSKKRG